MSASAAEGAFASYLEKWLEAEPEARLMRLFVPAARAPGTAATLVMLHELESAAFALEPRPAQAKLAWWQEELRRHGEGAPRHPITLALGPTPGDASLAPLPAATARWLELDAVPAFGQWLAFASSLAEAQARALVPAAGVRETDPAPVLARILSRFERLAADPRGLLPLDVLTQSGATRAEVAAEPGGAAAVRVLAALADRALAVPAPAEYASDLTTARSYLARRALGELARGRAPERAARPGLAAVLGLRRALRRRRRSLSPA